MAYDEGTETIADAPVSGFEGLVDGPLLGRYDIHEEIGRGGAGIALAATDLLIGDAVVVKVVPRLRPSAMRQFRRELATLLVLRQPGVVRLRDEGVLGRFLFVVTERVEGAPFSTLAEQGPPERWLRSVVALLDILARVHHAGVVHADLKPGNVLVAPDGRPTVLDFGLAQGRLVGREAPAVEGTPRYMAPEQREGKPVTPATDLYQVAGMVLEMLAGEPLRFPPQVEVLERGALDAPVADQLRRMLSLEPAKRPPSALHVLRALDADPLPRPFDESGEVALSMATLESLFDDLPHSVLHLAEDGAALLFAVTQGSPERVSETLRAWIRLGVAHWTEEGTLVVTREGLDRLAMLQPDAPESVVAARMEAGEAPGEVAASAEAWARALVQQGKLHRAIGLLDAVSLWARNSEAEARLLELRVNLRLTLRREAHTNAALHAVNRAGAVPPSLREEITILLRGARAAHLGDAQRALDLLDFEPVALGDLLCSWRRSLRAFAAQRLDMETHKHEVEAAALEAGALHRADWAMAQATLRYRQGRYPEAAALAGQAVEEASFVAVRAAAACFAAAALLECDALEEASDMASQAAEMAIGSRIPRIEAQARWLDGVIAYRQGRHRPPSVARVDAIGMLEDPQYEGSAAYVEAAFAWRQGDVEVAVALANRAVRCLRVARRAPLRLLMEALSTALGEPREVARLAEESQSTEPEIELQVLALLADRGLPPTFEARAHQLLDQLDPPRTVLRLDLLSIPECAQAFGRTLTKR